MAQGQQHLLGEAEWDEVRRRHAPRLRIDLANNRAFVGYGEIDNVPPTAYKLLRYLYEHPRRRCSRDELYYRAYQELDTVPLSVRDEGMGTSRHVA